MAIERFEFRYGLEHAALPAVAELGGVKVTLERTGGAWSVPAAALGEELALSQIPAGSLFGNDALARIAQELVAWFNARGLYGVWVAFSELESSNSGVVDLRPAGDRTARLVIWASQISEVRTLARGGRFDAEESINNPKHRRIIAGSPLLAGTTPEAPGSLFRQDLLEGYLRNLSQHPGRQVEASIASAGVPGKIVLDYLVTEPKPWMLFGQTSNSGTKSTGEWRQRVAFQHNQVTNHDDILNVDAITTPDFDTYGAFVSYRRPIASANLSARVFGSYGDFLANDLTFSSLRFAGLNWLGGFEIGHRFTLPWSFTLQSVLGASYVHYEAESQISGTTLGKGSSNFLIPFLNIAIGQDHAGWSLAGGFRVDSTVGSVANTDSQDGVSALGRIGADSSWTSIRGNLNGSIYLDRFFDRSKESVSLTSEASIRVRGRFLAKGERLIPQEQEPIGGMFSVRGYPESFLSADEFVMASAEFAYHLPRALKPADPGRLFGRPFRWRPTAQQRPDWDLIFRAFYDYAYRWVSLAPSRGGQASTGAVALVDRSLPLNSAGGGVELVLRPYFSIRCDVGMALTALHDRTLPPDRQVVISSGDTRVYLNASFQW